MEEYTTPNRGDTDFFNNLIKIRIEQLVVSHPQTLGDLCILPIRNQQDQIPVRKRAQTPQSKDSSIISPANQLLTTPKFPDQPSTSHLRDAATPILTLTQRQPTPAPPTNTPASSTKSPTPLQELRRAVARHIEKNPRYQRAQPNQPAQQSGLREGTRVGYKE